MGHNNWTENMDTEDLNFIKRFILASGSLKEMAGQYGVSYPTVRLRLDRLIQKIQIFDENNLADAFELSLRTLHAENRIETEAFKKLLTEYQDLKEKTGENNTDN